jgi:hypothetical protein
LHEAEAADLLRRALDDIGLSSTRFDTRIIRSLSEARQVGFVGSPTILINGADPFRLPGYTARVGVPDISLRRGYVRRP